MNRDRRPLPALTGLRFFLAIWVVVFHLVPDTAGLEIPWLPQAPKSIDCLLRTGYIAVTIFFALSGFVLAYNYDLGHLWRTAENRRFAVARFARIYPAYLLGLIALIPVAMYRAVEAIPQGEYAWGSGLLNIVLLQAWVPGAALTWNYPGWSLSCEAFFYAAFPLLGYLLWKLRRPEAMIAALGGLWIWSMAGPLVAVLLPIAGFGDVAAAGGAPAGGAAYWVNLISYDPLSGLPAFLSGIVLARLFRMLPADSRWFGRGGLFSIPAAVAMIVVLANADRLPLALVHNGLLLPVYSALIFGLALGGGFLATLLSIPALVFLGNASYAMYILHFPIAEWMLLSGKFLWQQMFHGIGWVLCYTATVIVGSSLFYKLAEEPLHLKLRSALNPKRIRSPQLAG